MESAIKSSIKSKLYVEKLEKDDSNVPKQSKGVFWSITHKPDFVGGVVSQGEIGIDLEQVKSVSDALFRKVVKQEERNCFGSQEKDIVFFRAFTAKEAVLKKNRIGIKGLTKTKIIRVYDDNNLIVDYLGEKYLVENFYFEDYLASITKDHFDVRWTLLEK